MSERNRENTPLLGKPMKEHARKLEAKEMWERLDRGRASKNIKEFTQEFDQFLLDKKRMPGETKHMLLNISGRDENVERIILLLRMGTYQAPHELASIYSLNNTSYRDSFKDFTMKAISCFPPFISSNNLAVELPVKVLNELKDIFGPNKNWGDADYSVQAQYYDQKVLERLDRAIVKAEAIEDALSKPRSNCSVM